MRNINRIQQMTLEELATYFVHEKTVMDWGDKFTVYMSPSGRQRTTYKEAIDDCIDWLDSEQSISLKNRIKKIDEYFDGLTADEFEKVVLKCAGKTK